MIFISCSDVFLPLALKIGICLTQRTCTRQEKGQQSLKLKPELDARLCEFTGFIKCEVWSLRMNFNFNIHIKTKSVFYHLKNISRMKAIMSQQDLKKRVHVFIFSRLDYCNAAFTGLRSDSCSWFRVLITVRPGETRSVQLSDLYTGFLFVKELILKYYCWLTKQWIQDISDAAATL